MASATVEFERRCAEREGLTVEELRARGLRVRLGPGSGFRLVPLPDDGALRCAGCGERVGATHYGWCEVGAYATAVTREECEVPEPEGGGAGGEQLAFEHGDDGGRNDGDGDG